MQEYASKNDLIKEIEKTSQLFIKEFDEVLEEDKEKMIEGVDRTPLEMIAYQLGWLDLIRTWDKDEKEGKIVITPAPEYKWNKLGELYKSFYDRHREYTLDELKEKFKEEVNEIIKWVDNFSEEELFIAGSRKWASSTPSNWPIWKLIHINTVAPFKSFRIKIQKWKKLAAYIR